MAPLKPDQPQKPETEEVKKPAVPAKWNFISFLTLRLSDQTKITPFQPHNKISVAF